MINFIQQFCCYSKREKPDKSTRPSKQPTFLSVQPIKSEIHHQQPPIYDPILVETDHYLQLDSEFYPQSQEYQQSTQPPSNMDYHFTIDNYNEVQNSPDSVLEEQDCIYQKQIRKIPVEQPAKKKRILKLWDEAEDALLRMLYEKHNGKWSEIAKHIQGRNPSQCAQRWRRLQPVKIIKSKQWTQQEDQQILELVQALGKNWKQIALHFPGILSKQIRERYINKIDPLIKNEAWTDDEDQIILKDYLEHGCKWSLISSHLVGRPENMVKNRFYSYIRRVHLGLQNPYQKVYEEQSSIFDSSVIYSNDECGNE